MSSLSQPLGGREGAEVLLRAVAGEVVRDVGMPLVSRFLLRFAQGASLISTGNDVSCRECQRSRSGCTSAWRTAGRTRGGATL
jgi:hypothetical protein